MSVGERNLESTSRIAAVGGRLSDEELVRVIDDPWTAAGLLAHIAFWDRFVMGRWILANERGERTPLSVDDGVMDRVNDASLDHWMSIPPRVAVELCLTAAGEVDGYLAGLDPDVTDRVVTEGRERLVDRSLHRGEHLRTIEGAFPAA
jgi:DinB superfamily